MDVNGENEDITIDKAEAEAVAVAVAVVVAVAGGRSGESKIRNWYFMVVVVNVWECYPESWGLLNCGKMFE